MVDSLFIFQKGNVSLRFETLSMKIHNSYIISDILKASIGTPTCLCVYDYLRARIN